MRYVNGVQNYGLVRHRIYRLHERRNNNWTPRKFTAKTNYKLYLQHLLILINVREHLTAAWWNRLIGLLLNAFRLFLYHRMKLPKIRKNPRIASTGARLKCFLKIVRIVVTKFESGSRSDKSNTIFQFQKLGFTRFWF